MADTREFSSSMSTPQSGSAKLDITVNGATTNYNPFGPDKAVDIVIPQPVTDVVRYGEAQTLTNSQQTMAKKNIGLGDSVHQPPVNPQTILAGTLVWDPDHTSVYRLLENWSYSIPWANITKKVRVMPYPENDSLAIDIDMHELNDNKPGTYVLVTAILSFGKPYIRLHAGNDEVVIFEYAEYHKAGSSGTFSYIFRTWQPSAGDPPTHLSFEQITVTSLDNINFSGFTVNL